VRIFITGISGLLGANFAFQQRDSHEVGGSYLVHPFAYSGITAARLDITVREEVVTTIAETRPDVVIHTAGIANVDECEVNEKRAFEVNASGSLNVAIAAQACGARLVHISTDHLWSDHRAMIGETEPPRPLNAYARSKLLAEEEVSARYPESLIVRTNFFGWGTTLKGSLSEWVLSKLSRNEPLRMFHDVFITPILINDLVDLIMLLVSRGAQGVYHVCGRDRVSKYEFGRVLATEFGYDPEGITPISVQEHSLIAPRPSDMSLSSDKAERFIGRNMPPLVDSVKRLAELQKQGWPQLLATAVAANVEK